MSATLISLTNALGWTLIHSLWQAAVIFFILRLLLIMVRNAPARVKYYLSLTALAGIMLCTLITFIGQWQSQQERLAVFITSTFVERSASVPSATTAPSVMPGIDSLLPWIDGLYIIGLFIFSGKVFRDVIALFIIRKNRIRPFDPAWEKYLLRLAKNWNMTGRVKLYLSEYIHVPVVIGYFKPVIYLPFTLANNLTSDQIEAILLHELAHVKRNDFLVNIFQTVVETLLFFNPFVLWISKNIRTERENSCDDMVITSTQPKLYAETLLAISEEMLTAENKASYKGRFVLAAVDRKQELFSRIKRMMENKTKKLNVMQKLLVLLILLGSISSLAWLAPGKKINTKATSINPQSDTSIEEIEIKDTTVLPSPPPAPTVTPPVAPPPPPHKKLPPPPPPPPMQDSLPDSIASMNSQKQLKDYYQSAEWKSYQKELKAYQKKMQSYFNSSQWKNYQKEMEAYAHRMKDEFNSSKWKTFQKDFADKAREMAEREREISERFQGDAWRQHLDSVRKTLEENRINIDSMVAGVRQEALKWKNKNLMGISAYSHTLDTRHIVNLMELDGLLKNKSNYTIRLNKKGLYIDGKKQDAKYYEKYKNIIGDNTTLEIKKHNGNIKSDITTKEESPF